MIFGNLQRLVIKNRNGDKIIGVVLNNQHFRTGSEVYAPEIKDLTLDIGAQNEDEVRERGIDIGDTIVPHTPFTQLLNIDRALKHGIIVMVVSWQLR